MENGVGARLTEVRKDLGLSQAAFAELVGVSLSSQRRYENGTRSPDTDYLAGLKRCGIDVDFVLTSIGVTQAEYENLKAIQAFQGIILDIGARLGRDHESLRGVIEYPLLTPSIYSGRDTVPASVIDVFFAGCSLDVDSTLLASVIEGVEIAASKLNIRVLPTKKAHAITMLYRSFKPSGKVDPAMIEETVKLAAS